MRKLLFSPCLLFAITLAVSTGVYGQEGREERPKVGIALSGGGAKGFSHIGVLKVLEKAGIRPDYITGTSMGSIVGGLYAMGYSADSLEQLAKTQNWSKILTDELPLQDVIFEEKRYFKNQLVELPIVKGKIRGPSGLIQGQEIDNMLARLTLPVYDITNFDSLATPFRCMAVDLYSGKPVELYDGSLSEALRASMAIPSVFTPVRKDSMVLVDGGLIRNFPVQELKKMGADIIIGVHSGRRFATMEELEGLTGILPQAIFLGSVQDSEEQMKDVDLYIEPVIDPYGAPDFGSVDSILARGETCAQGMFEQLKSLADSLNQLGPPPERPEFSYPTSVKIDRLEVEGNDRISEAEILGRAEIEAGTEIKPADLDEAIANLYGTNYFVKISYSLRRENGENVLTFLAVERAPALIKGSLIYDSYHNVGLAFSFTLRNKLGPASRLMFVGRLANNYRYRLSYLKYLNKENDFFVETSAQFNRDILPVISEGRETEELLLQESPLDLMLYKRINRNLLLGLGGQLDFLRLKQNLSSTPLFDRLRYTNLNTVGSLQLNSLDRNVLPTAGIDMSLEFRFVNNLRYNAVGLDTLISEVDSIFSFDPYPKFTFQAKGFIPLGPRSSMRIFPFAGFLFSGDNAFSDFYLMGTPEVLSRRSFPFIGLDANEYIAQVALGTSFGFQYFLWGKLMMAADISAGFFAEPELGTDGFPRPDEFLAGAGFTAGYNTLIGPVKLSLMYPIGGEGAVTSGLKLFLTIGHRF